MMLGKTTPSFDLETEVDAEHDIGSLNSEVILAAAKRFEGQIQQVPPVFSAIKVQGKRAYESARAGKDIELKARTIEIRQFVITAIELPYVSFKVICSKGTYIRSLARDFGEYLNVGAHLTALRRTRIGEFNVSNAQRIEDITAK